MEERTELQKLPSRIKYYLLEWKDIHMDEYLREFGEVRLNDMTIIQLSSLFSYAVVKDRDFLWDKCKGEK